MKSRRSKEEVCDRGQTSPANGWLDVLLQVEIEEKFKKYTHQNNLFSNALSFSYFKFLYLLHYRLAIFINKTSFRFPLFVILLSFQFCF